MVATAGSILGNYAPQMEEPYGIETALAKGASQGSQALEGTMLDSYWLERQMREGDYAQRLANQMAFGQQYLAQQGNDAAMRAITEGAKTPGVLNMLASSPQYGGMFAGMDPGAINNAADMAQRIAQSSIYKNTGQGTQGFATAGANIPPEAISAATGIPGVTLGPSLGEKAAAVRNQGIIEAARIKAAASGAGGGSVSVSGQPDPDLNNQIIHRTLPKGSGNWTQQQIKDYLIAHGAGGTPQVASPYGTGAQNTAPPPVVTGRTNLPPAKTDTPANAPVSTTPATPATPQAPPTKQTPIPPGTTITPAMPGGKNLIDAVKAGIPGLQTTPQQKADLQNFSLRMGTDGQIHLHGGTGTDYGALPKPGAKK